MSTCSQFSCWVRFVLFFMYVPCFSLSCTWRFVIVIFVLFAIFQLICKVFKLYENEPYWHCRLDELPDQIPQRFIHYINLELKTKNVGVSSFNVGFIYVYSHKTYTGSISGPLTLTKMHLGILHVCLSWICFS